MSKLLVKLLGVNERNFLQLIERLERLCLQPGIDIRLSSEIISKTRQKARALLLDPNDTTPKELYFALKNKLRDDDKELMRVIGLANKTPAQTAGLLAGLAEKLSHNEHVLALTANGAKRILRAVPPRKTLRALKLRSLEAVLKREDSRILYALAAQLEDESWRSQVYAKMKRLPAKDIVWQSVAVTAMPASWFEKIRNRLKLPGLLMTSPETGTIILLPLVKKMPEGGTVLALGLVLQAAQRLAVESLPYRRRGFLQGYHMILPEIALGQQPVLSNLHGLTPSWQAVYELYIKGFLVDELPEMEFLLSDLNWQSIEMKLAGLLPSFDFWADSHFLGMDSEETPVSLHFLDVAHAVVTKAPFQSQTNFHLEKSLWNELQLRYLQQENLLRSLRRQLLSTEADVV